MLEHARRQPGGEGVTWVHAAAQSVRLDRRFDLVLRTGHAFQVFLNDDEQRAVLSRIAEHLAPEGRLIFDTRNPAKQAWRNWTPEASRRLIEHPNLGAIEAWNNAVHGPAMGIVTYETHYRVKATGRSHFASSKIYFNTRESLEDLLHHVGLKADEWLGDWAGNPATPSSPEIIPIGRLG